MLQHWYVPTSRVIGRSSSKPQHFLILFVLFNTMHASDTAGKAIPVKPI